jgi:hypothetical protein
MEQEVSMLLEPARIFLLRLGEFLPKLLVAILVLAAGWLLANAVRFGVTRGLRAVNFNVLGERSGIDAFLRQGGISTGLVGILAALAYWVVILVALIMAFNTLGLTYINDLLARVVWFVPKVIAAVLILAFGAYFARFLGNAVSAYCVRLDVPDGDLLGRIAHYAILIFVLLIALDQLGIGGEIIRQSFLIILAGLVFGLALAFGLGGKRWAEGLLERWYPEDRRRRTEDKAQRAEDRKRKAEIREED